MKQPSRARGFTLLEIALAVLVMGLVAGTLMASRNSASSATPASDLAMMDEIVARLFTYAQRNGRLPCPDADTDGNEDVSGATCTSLVRTGGVPYTTLGMRLPSPVGTGVDREFVYSVYQGGGAEERNLTVRAERSLPVPHTAHNAGYADAGDFQQAVINAIASAAVPDALETYVTGDAAGAGAADCSSNRVANVAFVVAFSNRRDADGQGGNFDGVNLAGTRTCFAGPRMAPTPVYDDRVRAVSFVELLGVLNR